MKLQYETGVATMIQFISMSLLGIPNGLNSIISTCRHDHNDCVSNLIVSLIFFLLTVAWFGAVWVLAYAAQERRSRLLAQLLIGAEAMIALVALFNARHHTDLLGLTTSLIDLALAVWIMLLSYRLMRSGGKRISGRGRTRKRRTAARS